MGLQHLDVGHSKFTSGISMKVLVLQMQFCHLTINVVLCTMVINHYNYHTDSNRLLLGMIKHWYAERCYNGINADGIRHITTGTFRWIFLQKECQMPSNGTLTIHDGAETFMQDYLKSY